MGLIARIFGGPGAVGDIGSAVTTVAEVFVPNATKKMTLRHEAFAAALGQYGGEFQGPLEGRFDRVVNALNRLPRPALAIGTLGLFVYAMISPDEFAVRMQGLSYVPEPLWWLLGAIVSFYFGARELHHGRGIKPVMPVEGSPELTGRVGANNPALDEIRARAAR